MPELIRIRENWRLIPELAGKHFSGMAVDRQGTAWFCSLWQGVWSYDGVRVRSHGLQGIPLQAIAAQNGHIYVASDYNIHTLKDGKWQELLPHIHDILWMVAEAEPDHDGGIWFGSLWGALYLRDGRWTFYTTAQIATAFRPHLSGMNVRIVPASGCAQIPDAYGWGMKLTTSLSLGYLSWVRALAPDGPAFQAGLRVGDRVEALDDIPLSRQMQDPDRSELVIQVWRNDTSFKVRLKRHPSRQRILSIFDPTSILPRKNSRIIFALCHAGVVFADLDNDRWQYHSRTRSPALSAGGWADCRVAEDAHGDVWLIAGHSLLQYHDGKWQEKKRLFNGIISLTNYYGYVLSKERTGLTLWTPGSPIEITNTNIPLPDPAQHSARIDSLGRLWFYGNVAAFIDLRQPRWQFFPNLRFQTYSSRHGAWALDGAGKVFADTGDGWHEVVINGLKGRPRLLRSDFSGRIWLIASPANNRKAEIACLDGGQWHIQRFPKFQLNHAQRWQRNWVWPWSKGLAMLLRIGNHPYLAELSCNNGAITSRTLKLSPSPAGSTGVWLPQTNAHLIGAWNGLLTVHIKRQTTRYEALPQKIGAAGITCLLPEAEDTLWIGTYRGGILKRHHQQIEHWGYARKLQSEHISEIIRDGKNRLWALSSRELLQYQATSWRSIPL
ncbi:MAG: hypothetical protein D6820_10385, partial [Lentisphaerae bacterium]